MEPNLNNLWIVIYSLSALHGVFIGVILLKNKGTKFKPNYFLGGLILSIALILTGRVLYMAGTYHQFPHLLSTSFPLWFLVGPLFYYYFKKLIAPDQGKSARNVIHLLPLIICLIMLMPLYVLSGQEKIMILNGESPHPVTNNEVLMLLYLYSFQTIIYVVLTSRMLKKYEKQALKISSDSRLGNIQWLNTLIRIMIIFLLIDLTVGTAMALTGIENEHYGHLSVIIIAGIIYYIAYVIMLYPGRIFPEKTALTGPVEKYENSQLTQIELERLKLKLLQIMDTQKPYLKDDLKLVDLARELGVPAYVLSQLINQVFELNFYKFINSYRVEEAKRLLLAPEYKNSKIFAVAMDAGFNSSAAFYRAFRENTGLTPSRYIKTNPSKVLESS